MSNELLFTFVVPACNVAAYARQMIESLKMQTYSEFEALIINEESSDNTADILEEAIAGDPRFKLIFQKRSGSASASRNYGINHARGKYLVFIDGDDWIEPDSLEKFHQLLNRQSNFDLLSAGFRTWQGENTPVPGKTDHDETPCSGLTALERMFRDGTYHSATWCRIYRREFLTAHQLYQEIGRHHQDDEWTPRVYYFAQKTISTDFIYYNYRKRENSITTKRSCASLHSVALNMQSFFAFWHTHKIPSSLKEPLAHWYCGFLGNFFAPFAQKLFERTDRKSAFAEAMNHQLKYYLPIALHGRPGDKLFALLGVVPLVIGRGIGFRWGEILFIRIFYRNLK